MTLVIRRSGPIAARVRPPGSKSITNRALIAAALADGTSTLFGALVSDDTAAMTGALTSLGVTIEWRDEALVVHGRSGHLGPHHGVIDAGASGTTARFVTAALTLGEGRYVLDGVPRMRERPIGELADALNVLGGEVSTDAGFPPVAVRATGLRGGEVEIDASRSSQFVSAVMLVAPFAETPVILRFKDGVAVSRPYLQTSAETMRAFGAQVDVGPTSIAIAAPGGYRGTRFSVEVDASAATYPLVAAAIAGGSVVIEGLSGQSTQADLGVLRALEQMGCQVERFEDSIRLSRPEELQLTGITLDMNDMPDAVLAIAVAAVFAGGVTTIENVGNLRLKETDRLAALETELRKLGVDARASSQDLVIVPTTQPHGARISTYDDHRMAMAFSLAGLRIPGVEIENPECVAKTWPGFFSMLESLRTAP